MQVLEPSLKQFFDLSSQAAIVTGGGKGIGRAIALRLGEAGAAVVVVDADERAGIACAQEIATAGGRARFIGGDVADPASAQRAVDACVEAYGHVDVLVNNAGIFPFSPALQTTAELWDKVMAVNLKGAFLFAQAAARKMIESGGGSIVNIASIDALHPTGALVHYDASKGGMLMMTKSLALELGKSGVRVNAICPGGVTTPGADAAMAAMSAGLGASAQQITQGFAQKIPLGRMGLPDDIARATLFFATPLSAYCTGSVLVVDGGFLLS